MDNILIKLTFVHGLQEIVLREIAKHPELQASLHIVERDADCVYFGYGEMARAGSDDDSIDDADSAQIPLSIYLELLKLRTITSVYIVKKGSKLHPLHISHHKSILGDMIEFILFMNAQLNLHATGAGTLAKKRKAPKKFKTFKLRCAGSDSPEAISIQKYISDTFKLTLADEADLDIYIHKPGELWEIGMRITQRPLSLREYKTEHIKGGMNPTIAYAANILANLEPAIKLNSELSYLNICSGSGTFLTEAGLALGKDIAQAKLMGFDKDKTANSQAIRNITNASLIKSIQIKTVDLLDDPDFGTFDIIASDLPFGMQIGKDADLPKLYKHFVKYAEKHLKPQGTLVAYTTEIDIFGRALKDSKFFIEKDIALRIITATNTHIHPKIFVCKFK